MTTVARTERVLRDLATAQHGMATRAQLRDRGVTVHAIDRMVRTGRPVAVRPGLYQIGPVPVGHAAEAAAVLACGPESRLSHSSAAALLNLLDASRVRAAVEVTVPRETRRRHEGIRIRRVRDLRPDEMTVVEGIRVTTPARTLLDIAGTLTSRQVEQALARALRRGLVTAEALRCMLIRHPYHRGTAPLRELLDADGGPALTRSDAEEKLLAIIRTARLPRAELNVKLLGHEVDFLWRGVRVVAEVDGYAFHGSARAFAADRRRDADLAAAGYRVLRFTWADVTEDRLATTARLAQALAPWRSG